MATSQLDFKNSKSDLDFQEFTFDSADKTDPPPEYEESHETEDLLPAEETKAPSFWEFSYYQSFFDVTTDKVINRIIWSMIPLPGRATFLHRCIKPAPDLYGPFWISATLVLAIAMGGNIADYLHSAGKQTEKWHYDFHKVSLAATTVYSYSFLVPLGLWGIFWYRQSTANYTLMDLFCLYGYSMAIYIPISLLCILQYWWLQWTLVLLGAFLSGSVLLLTLWPAVKDDTKKISCIILLVVLALHVLLATGFLAYFFQPNHNKAQSVGPALPVTGIVTDSTTIALPDVKPDKLALRSNKKLESQNHVLENTSITGSIGAVPRDKTNQRDDTNYTTIEQPRDGIENNLSHLSIEAAIATEKNITHLTSEQESKVSRNHGINTHGSNSSAIETTKSFQMASLNSTE